jgi:2-succinyl-5-enolpyruvyl-6-hydroxy-3-cyclohexene-1-carboxylate synthase
MAFARHPAIEVLVHIDERSGSFFALGLAKRTGTAVVLVCTSGTAAAEFHPAVVEASYSATPLIVLTADRPPELIGVGANQAIDQSHLYGTAVRWFADPGVPEVDPGAGARWRQLAARAIVEATGPPAGPVHLNLPFREPLTPDVGESPAALGGPSTAVTGRRLPTIEHEPIAGLAQAWNSSARPLILAGEMRFGGRLAPVLRRILTTTGGLLFAEPTSQLRLRGMPGLAVRYDLILATGTGPLPGPDLVIRLGGPPTSKNLNRWLGSNRVPTIVIDADLPGRDPDRLATTTIPGDPLPVLESVAGLLETRPPPTWRERWLQVDGRAEKLLDEALSRSELFEAHAVQALRPLLGSGDALMVGSSMAIRDIDTFLPALEDCPMILANRGASGIDGLVSTGLGAGLSGGRLVMLIGDLSLYHDMNGLWAIRRHGVRTTLVVLDNDGGGIFSHLPPSLHSDVFEELFGTPLSLDLADVARLYGLEFVSVNHPGQLARVLADAIASPASTLVAVRFSRESSLSSHVRVIESLAMGLGRSR